MADTDLGTARGKIDIDADGAVAGAAKATGAVESFEEKTNKSANTLLKTGAIVGGVGLGIAAGFGVAINAAANFEERISAVAAVSGATEQQLELVRKKALQLGADTKFSATDAAQAMEELVKAGLSVDDVLNGAADATVNLAAAGEIDLPRAAELAANAMNVFSLKAEDMPHVADLIAGAANASAISVEEFGQSLQQSGAAAALAGITFDDLSVAIAEMGNAGIKGSDAGTSLKTMLLNLNPTTAKQATLMKELGIITEDGSNKFFDAAGNAKGLADISQVLQDSLAGMTKQQKLATLDILFGSDAIRAAAVLSDQGAKGFNNLADSMGKVSAQDVAEKRMDNLKGSIEQLKGSAETLAIVIGLPLAKALRTWVDHLTDLINAFTELDPSTREQVVTILQVVSAVLIVVGALIALAGVIQKVRIAMTLLNGTLFANPIGLVILAIVALVVALVVLYQKNQAVREAIQGAWQWIKDNVIPIIDQVVLGFKAMVAAFNGEGITSDGLVGFFERIGVAARAVWSWITGTLVPALQSFADFLINDVGPAIADFATKIANGFMAFVNFITGTVVPAIVWFASEVVERFDSAFGWLQDNVFPIITALAALIVAAVKIIIGIIVVLAPLWRTIWTVITNVIKFAIDTIMTVVDFFVDALVTLWQLLGDNLIDIITTVWNIIVGVVSGFLQAIRGIIQLVTGIITLDWGLMWEGIKNIVMGVWNFITTLVAGAGQLLLLTITTILDLIHAAWSIGWDLVGTILEIAWSLIKTVISTALTFVSGLIQTALTVIVAFWRGVWNTVKSILSAAWEAVKTNTSSAISAVVSFVAGLPERAKAALAGILTALVSRGKQLIQGLKDGAVEIALGVINWAADLPSDIADAVGDLGSFLYDKGKDLIQGLIDGIDSMLGPLDEIVGGIAGGIADLWPGSPVKRGPLKSFNRGHAGAELMRMLITGIDSMSPEVTAAMTNTTDMVRTAQPLAALPAGQNVSSGNSGDIHFHFPNVTSGDPEEIKKVLTDPKVLRQISLAVRARRPA